MPDRLLPVFWPVPGLTLSLQKKRGDKIAPGKPDPEVVGLPDPGKNCEEIGFPVTRLTSPNVLSVDDHAVLLIIQQ